MPLDGIEEVVAAECGQDDQGAGATRRQIQSHCHSVRVEERHRAQDAFAVDPGGKHGFPLVDVGAQRGVREIDTFGPSRRAACVLKKSKGRRGELGWQVVRLRAFIAACLRDDLVHPNHRQAQGFGQGRHEIVQRAICNHCVTAGVLQLEMKFARGVFRIHRQQLGA